MRAVKQYPFSVLGNDVQQLLVDGAYFRIESSTGPVTVTGDFGELQGLQAGQGLKGVPFTRLLLKNQSVTPVAGVLLVSDSEFIDNRVYGDITGNVKVNQNNFNVVAYSIYLTVFNGAQHGAYFSKNVLLENQERKYLFVQNQGAGNVFLILGNYADGTGGIVLEPGQAFEMSGSSVHSGIVRLYSVVEVSGILVLEG